MKTVKLTVMRKAAYPDLMEAYENQIEAPCTLVVGQVFRTAGERPAGLCESAWKTLSPFVSALLGGGGDFFGGWMKDPKSAMLSCNDGFRPVSFYVELEET